MTPFFGHAGTIVLYIFALIAARLAIRTARSPQGATGWVVFLLSFPLLALPAFAVFGGVYRMNRHRAPKTLDQISESPEVTTARLSDLQKPLASHLTLGNRVSLLVDGETTFSAILEAIEGAKDEVLVQYYTLDHDDLGQTLKQHLIDAQTRGVKVRILVDAMGSFMLSRTFIGELRDAGVDFRGNFTFRRSFYRLGLNFRDHRKTVVVDGEVGFTGGVNARQCYIDGGKTFDSWRDTFLKLEGPVVKQLRECFAAGWHARTDETIPALSEAPQSDGDMKAMHVALGPTDERDTGTLLILGLIGKAKDRIWITTPYLVPPPEVSAALKLAAGRGIDVRILVPQPLDKYLPWLASRSYFRTFHEAGIGIYEYKPGFMHQKVMLIDDDIASVGTVNLDFRSIMLNFEQTVLVEDEAFCKDVAAMLEDDMANCSQYQGDKQPWLIRFFAPVAQLMAPVL